MMIAEVDADACVGCERCVDTCPVVFQMDGGVAVVKPTPVPANEEAACRKAVEACPVTAITIEV